jgi:hypothetical protein
MAARESRSSRPTLTIALQQYENAKETLEDFLKSPPDEALDKNAMLKFGRTAKELYHKYASHVKVLMRIYALCASFSDQKDLFAEKNNMRDEVDIAISFTNAVTEDSDRLSAAVSQLSISTLASVPPSNAHENPSPISSVAPTIEDYPEFESDSLIIDPEMVRRNETPRANPQVLESSDNDYNRRVISNPSPDFTRMSAPSENTEPTVRNAEAPSYYEPPMHSITTRQHTVPGAHALPENIPSNVNYQPPVATQFNQPNQFTPVNVPYVHNVVSTVNTEPIANRPSMNYHQLPRATVGSTMPTFQPAPYYIPAPDSASFHLVKQELFKKPANPFRGDPDKFLVWHPSITNMMRGINLSAFDQLLILEAHTEGEPQKMIREKIAICGANPNLALKECWDDLFRNYGSGNQIAEALINKVDTIQPIRSVHNTEKLKDLLSICKLILANMPLCKELQIFDLSLGIKKIFFKLPDSFQDGWREQELNYQHSHGQSAPLQQLVSYLERKILKYSIPAYRRTAFTTIDGKKNNNFENKPHKNIHSYQTLKDETSPDFNETDANHTVKPKQSENLPTSPKANNQPKFPDKDTSCLLHETGNHLLKDCYAFSRLPHDKKRAMCFENGLCYLCLKRHRQRDCSKPPNCEKCDRKHLTIMHKDYQKPEYKRETDEKTSLCTVLCGNKEIYKNCSKTVLVDVTLPNVSNKRLRCYCIIDEQSSSSFVDEKLASFFNLSSPIVTYNLTTLAGLDMRTQGIEISGLFIRGVGEKKGFSLPKVVTNNALPQNKNEIATPNIVRAHAHISHLSKYFNNYDASADVLLLLGRDCGNAMATKVHGHKVPFAHHTSLGWALVGATCFTENLPERKTVLKTTVQHEHFKRNMIFSPTAFDKVNNCFDIFEETPLDEIDCNSKEDQKFLEIVNNGIHITSESSISMPLPFKKENPQMPDNKIAVYHRTKNTLTRLKNDKFKLDQSVQTMQKYLDAGHVEELTGDELSSGCWYLPVFPVTHPQKQKVRLVFDSSAKYKEVSLNSELLQGPDITNRLKGVLLKFRRSPIGFCADIEGMFHNFLLTPEHKNFTRFYWFSKNDPLNKLTEFRATRHVFGNTSSPALANIGLRFAIDNATPTVSPQVRNFVYHNFYVDDGLGCSDTVEEAINTISETKKALQQFNIRLCKINSNSPDVLNAFPVSECSTDKELVHIQEELVQPTLGVLWNIQEDAFILRTTVPERPFTKRGIISTINSIFDPIGIAAPIVLNGRLIQRAVLPSKRNPNPLTDKLDWDDPIPDNYLPTWNSWKQSLRSSEGLSIPRSYIPHDFGIAVTRELHVFSDASNHGIGYVMYLRTVNNNEAVTVSFVTGNSKVPPRMAISIPRLELCAAVEAATAAREVAIHLQIPRENVILYCDSLVVLGYLNNCTKRFSFYVTRRVNLALKLFNSEQWKYISTEINPGDIASRPHDHDSLKESCWFTGPSFLKDQTVNYPDNINNIDPPDLPETKTDKITLKTMTVPTNNFTKLIETCGTYNRAVSSVSYIVAFVARFIDLRRQQNGFHIAPRLQLNKDATESFIIKHVQRETFPHLLKNLINKVSGSNYSDSTSSLAPFLDSDGIIRVGGRLKNAELPINVRHPVLLPQKHHFSVLVIRHFHMQVKHQGRTTTLAAIRNAGYFIHHGSKTLRREISNCVTCKKLRGPFMQQLMSDLPTDRLHESPPFTSTGVDIFGPYMITDGATTRRTSSNKKMWAVIFTCLVTRATHLEALPMMDTSSFVNALRRFFAIRGNCRHLRSDQGSNLIGTYNQSATLCLQNIEKEIRNLNCTWSFNPPKASHHGGVWERKIGSIKSIINACLLKISPRIPTRDELCTFLQEAASIVNK